MSLVTVRERFQITLPRQLRDRFMVGGQIEILPTPDGGAVLRPMQVIPAAKTSFKPEEMAELIRLATEARDGVNTEGPYADMAEFIGELNKHAETGKD
jgi:bifunctional DNA-binding transcriptional regulator/antitoxin component of YhaV-PrlF toxin-antitoxin module